MATYTGTRKPSPRRHLAVVGVTALALGAAAGVGTWRIGLHSHRVSTAPHTPVQFQQTGGQAGTLPAATSSPVSVQTQHLYLTYTVDEAKEVCSGARQEDLLGQAILQPAAGVVIVDPALDPRWSLPPVVECHAL